MRYSRGLLLAFNRDVAYVIVVAAIAQLHAVIEIDRPLPVAISLDHDGQVGKVDRKATVIQRDDTGQRLQQSFSAFFLRELGTNPSRISSGIRQPRSAREMGRL